MIDLVVTIYIYPWLVAVKKLVGIGIAYLSVVWYSYRDSLNDSFISMLLSKSEQKYSKVCNTFIKFI